MEYVVQEAAKKVLDKQLAKARQLRQKQVHFVIVLLLPFSFQFLTINQLIGSPTSESVGGGAEETVRGGETTPKATDGQANYAAGGGVREGTNQPLAHSP